MAGAGGYLGSWSTPLLVQVGDRDELIVSHAAKLAAHDPRTGKELWTCDGLPEQVFASPTAGDGILVATAKFQTGGTQVLAVRLDDKAAGNVTATHRLWQTRLPKECVGSPVITAGHAYLVTQFGSIVCLDLRTETSSRKNASPARAPQRLLVLPRPRRRQALHPQPVRRGVHRKALPGTGNPRHQLRRRRGDLRVAGDLGRTDLPADV